MTKLIKIILSKNSEQDKSKKILRFVIDQYILSKDILGLIAEYWTYAESVSNFLPSLICQASNKFYKEPYVCANDSIDLVVYEKKVFDKYHIPCTPIPEITIAVDFLRNNGCKLKINIEHKFNNELRLNLDKQDAFIQSLCSAPLNKINFFNELKFQIEEAKKFKKNSIDLATIIQNYPYPLIIKRPRLTVQSSGIKYLSFFAAFRSTILTKSLMGRYSYNSYLSLLMTSFIYGNIFSKMQTFETSIKYITNTRSLRGNPCLALISKLNIKRLTINPLIAMAMINELILEMEHTKKIMRFYEINLPLMLNIPIPIILLSGCISFIAPISETLTCLDIYYSEKNDQKKNKQLIPHSKIEKALLCISIINSTWLIYDLVSNENRNDYQFAISLVNIIDFGISIPRLLLSSRNTAQDFKEVINRPRRIFESKHNEEGFRENFCTTVTKCVSRLSSGVVYGVLRYLYHNDPIRGIIAGVAAFNESSILNVIRWSPRMFRRFPTVYSPQEQKPEIELKIDDSAVLNAP